MSSEIRTGFRVYGDIAIIDVDGGPVLYATYREGRGWRCCHLIAYFERQLPLCGDVCDLISSQGFASPEALAAFVEEQLRIYDL